MWREALGAKIREAREDAGLTQKQLAEMANVTAASISMLERGKHSPAVKIVTDIASLLGTPFEIDGCRIEPKKEESAKLGPVLVPQQFKLPFDLEHKVSSTSVTLRKLPGDGVELTAILSGWRRV
jgi:transcriptional regulator with XRE-family HTH domain